MEFQQDRIMVNAEMRTETELAKYTLSVTQDNAEITFVSARIEMKTGPGVTGNVEYRHGIYYVGRFPWDEESIKAVMNDFKTVVEKIKERASIE